MLIAGEDNSQYKMSSWWH